jgi:hypothetical protein
MFLKKKHNEPARPHAHRSKTVETKKTEKNRMAPLMLLVLLILLVAVAAYFLFGRDEEPSPPAAPESAESTPPPPLSVSPSVAPLPPDQVAPPPAEPEPPPVLHPIEPLPSESPLPELSASDEPFRTALGEVTGRSRGLTMMLSEELIYHIVATVDNLPRKHLPASIVPVKRAEGPFIVDGKGESIAIGAGNARRYESYTAVAKALDGDGLVDLYRLYYPLFQRAYQELGYPQAHFNDRLVAAIDDLLAAPLPSAPVRLKQPRVLYEYADLNLENRSAGQKIMMRIGPENAAVLKAKLQDIRARIARQ